MSIQDKIKELDGEIEKQVDLIRSHEDRLALLKQQIEFERSKLLKQEEEQLVAVVPAPVSTTQSLDSVKSSPFDFQLAPHRNTFSIFDDSSERVIYISHVSNSIANSTFVNFEKKNNIYGFANVDDSHFDTTSGVLTVPESGLFLISVISFKGNTDDLYIKAQHPDALIESDGIRKRKCIFWKIPDQPISNISNYFQKPTHSQQLLDGEYNQIAESETFIYNLIKDTPMNLYALQQYKKSLKKNENINKLKWRAKKREKYQGKTGFFHFPEHSTIRLARELIEETPLPIDRSCFDFSPIDLFSKSFKVMKGTQISLVRNKGFLDDEENNEENGELNDVLLWSVGLIRVDKLSDDQVASKVKKLQFFVVPSLCFACFKCGKSFETSVQLLRHIRSKNYFPPLNPTQKEKPFVSPYGRKFSTQQALDQHLKDYRPFKCGQCHRIFKKEESLKRHFVVKHQSSTKVPNYFQSRRVGKCPFYRPRFCCVKERCGAIFMDAKFLAEHHKHKYHFYCPICLSKFFKKTHMFMHMKAKHTNSYKEYLKKHLQEKLSRYTLKTGYFAKTINRESLNQRINIVKEKLEKLGADITDIPLEEEKEVLLGSEMEKSPTSHSVINIIPPRHLWLPIQSVRTKFIADARCGPHFSFLDPFILPKYYPKAAELLREELSTIQPFKVILNKLNYFVHSRTISLYLEPETIPPDAFEVLLQKCLKVFPQCNDLVLRSKTNKYVPHMTIAKFETVEQMKEEYEKIKNNWQPLEFMVKELYFLSRIEGNPFEVKEVIHLGSDQSAPYFGPGSNTPGNMARTAVICSVPREIDVSTLSNTFRVNRLSDNSPIQMLKNPDGSRRSCGVVKFISVEEACSALQNFSGVFANSAERAAKFVTGAYLIPLSNATFPCYGPSDCCFLDAVLANTIQKSP